MLNLGQGGRVATGGGTLSSYVIRNLGISKRVEDDQDPREAILRFAKDAEENPYWIAPAYKKLVFIHRFKTSSNKGLIVEISRCPSSKVQKRKRTMMKSQQVKSRKSKIKNKFTVKNTFNVPNFS